MIAVVADGQATGRPWRLVSRTGNGADVLARSAVGGPARSLRQLCDGDGVLDVVPTGDRHFRWTLTSPEGDLIAESPAVYRDPAACRAAYGDARRAARLALGENRRPFSGIRPDNGDLS